MRLIALLLGVLAVACSHAEETPRILIVGVFHFSNPGLDAVKTVQIDVTTPESQRYLENLARSLADFRPTEILQEFRPEDEDNVNGEYRQFLEGAFDLGTSELHQLGFRLAKESGIERLYGIDEWGPQMKFGELQEYMEVSDPDTLKQFQALLAEFTASEEKAHAALNLKELLIRQNQPSSENQNMSLYLSTNHVGVGNGFVGADSTAAWWNRNFRMYANIQQYAKPGSRIIVIAGSGHASILRNLAHIDTSFDVENVLPYLDPD